MTTNETALKWSIETDAQRNWHIIEEDSIGPTLIESLQEAVDMVDKPDIKWCGRCRQSLPRENFAKNSAKKDGLQERCKDCRAEHYKSTGYADKAYENRIKRQYNLSLDELKWFEEQQEGCCAICKDNTPKLFVDHDHMTGEVRGLLCHYCNTGIGLFMDNPDRLKSAIQYLTEGTYDRYGE